MHARTHARMHTHTHTHMHARTHTNNCPAERVSFPVSGPVPNPFFLPLIVQWHKGTASVRDWGAQLLSLLAIDMLIPRVTDGGGPSSQQRWKYTQSLGKSETTTRAERFLFFLYVHFFLPKVFLGGYNRAVKCTLSGTNTRVYRLICNCYWIFHYVMNTAVQCTHSNPVNHSPMLI